MMSLENLKAHMQVTILGILMPEYAIESKPGNTRDIVISVVPAGGANICYNCCLGVPSK
jgi:hypothetical protein